jgi:hypothetical protein
MNAISYISGDPQITDFPERSARPLAAFVQSCNDLLAGPDGYLSPDKIDASTEGPLGGELSKPTAPPTIDYLHGPSRQPSRRRTRK